MDRRQHPRTYLDPPDICILRTSAPGASENKHRQCYFADILNRSPGGGLLKSAFAIPEGTWFHLSAYTREGKSWQQFEACVAWARQAGTNQSKHYLVGTRLRKCDGKAPQADAGFFPEKRVPIEADYEFFRQTELMRALPREAVVPLINSVFRKSVKAGSRFIAQGEHGNECYLIQRGTCIASLEKNGDSKRVARLREGSIVGEMALLTGEPRSSHVYAESDAELWAITRARFDELESSHPELRTFLTNVLTSWFDSRTMIADRHIGKYIITDVIGDGAFAIVYRGSHRDLNMPVAIKMMRHDMAMDPDFIASFRKEARTIARFNHQHIVKIFDIEERYRTVFIVMEYLAGITLRQILDTTPRLRPGKIVRYLRQICQGLRYAHHQGIVHLDIKPANIFVLPGDHVKIVDFGLACPCGTETLMSGTPFYMSPEQVECLPVDIRTDIYALGIMAYEMATGEKPFPAEDPWQVMDLHATRDIPDPANTVAEIPENLRRMIIKACARDPARRYQNADEILNELYPWMEGFGSDGPRLSPGKNQMTALCILHKNRQQPELRRLMEEFKRRLEDLGMVMHHMDLPGDPLIPED